MKAPSSCFRKGGGEKPCSLKPGVLSLGSSANVWSLDVIALAFTRVDERFCITDSLGGWNPLSSIDVEFSSPARIESSSPYLFLCWSSSERGGGEDVGSGGGISTGIGEPSDCCKYSDWWADPLGKESLLFSEGCLDE